MPNFSSVLVLSLVCSLSLGPASAQGAASDEGAFLQSAEALANSSPWLRRVCAEVERTLPGGAAATEERFAAMEGALADTFAAMPKNEHGRLGGAAVRYATHRFFVHRHGWFIRGLEPAGGSWSSAAESAQGANASRSWMTPVFPDGVAGIFEERFESRGFSLFELAALAATLETLVHGEATGKLQSAYRANNFQLEDNLTIEQADYVMDTYMAAYILGMDLQDGRSAIPAELMDLQDGRSVIPAELMAQIRFSYPNWESTQRFMRDMRRSVVENQTELSFDDMVDVVDAVSARYGRWQDRDCRDLKQELIAAGDGGTGCVPLTSFYRHSVHGGAWQFSESPEYLRNLGALDETNPASPQVIVPNYVNSPSNCLASSKYYSVCCIDECEEMLGLFERSLRSPEATVGEIAKLASDVLQQQASQGGGSRRHLPLALLARLDEIAHQHRGRVPLHSRLFAQWMHHTFPRECPYPHVAGAVVPLRVEDFEKTAGRHSSEVSADVLVALSATRAPSMPGVDDELSETEVRAGECTPWTAQEELFIPKARASDEEAWAAVVAVALLGIGASLSLVAARVCFLGGSRKSKGRPLVNV